jgi:predicted carbohydrate-binding protein with CBM5 and CBM33 domain
LLRGTALNDVAIGGLTPAAGAFTTLNAASIDSTGIATLASIVVDGGIFLGGSAAANKLDDYEEGTWTPTDVSGAGITGFNISHNQYTKIGRKVFAHCQITFPSSSNTTMVRLSLPFNTDTNSTNSATGGVCQEQNIGSGQTVIAAVNYTNAVIFRPNGYGNYNFSQLSSKTLRFAIHYNTA